MPGKRVCNSTIASPMVAALTSTSSSLLVNLRSGVGIRTFFGIIKNGLLDCWSNRLMEASINPAIHSSSNPTWFSCIHLFFMRQQRLEFAQAGLDFARFAYMAGHGVERLQSVAGDAKDRGIISRNFARRNEFLRHTHGHTAGRLGKNAFRLRQQLDGVADLVAGHAVSRCAGVIHHLKPVETVGPRAAGERFGTRVRLDRLEEIQPSLV